MTTSIKKVLIGCAAMAALVSPLFALASVLSDELKGISAGLEAQGYPANNAVRGAVANAIAAAAYCEKNPSKVIECRDALVRAQRRLRGLIDPHTRLPYTVQILTPKQEESLTEAQKKERAELKDAVDRAIAALEVEIAQLNAAIKAGQTKAQQPKSEAPAAAPAGTIKSPPLSITVKEKVINVLQFSVNLDKDKQKREFVEYVMTLNTALRALVPLFPFQIRFFNAENGKTITTVTVARANCVSSKDVQSTDCKVKLPATAKGRVTAIRDARATISGKNKKVIATLDVRGGKLFSGPPGAAQPPAGAAGGQLTQPQAPPTDQSSPPASSAGAPSSDSASQQTTGAQKTCRGDQLYQDGRPLGRFVCDLMGALVYCSDGAVTHTPGPVTDPRRPFCDPLVPNQIRYCARSGDRFILQTFTDTSAGCSAPAAGAR